MIKNNWIIALLLVLAAPLVGCGSEGGGASATVENGGFRLLVFTRTEGFRHASIPTGVETVEQLGLMHGFEVVHTEDPEAFNADNLGRFAAVMWLNTTGDVLDEAQQRAFEDYIANGGGYVGVHSASDTEYDWPFYGELVGAYFKNHPVFPVTAEEGPGVQEGVLRREAAEHPSTAHLPEAWTLEDEFYAFRSNPRGVVRVLMNIDEDSYNQDPNTSNLPDSDSFPLGETGEMNDHPMSWCHDNLGGMAWYSAIGHSIGLYDDGDFRQHLLGGILTAARRQPADCAPREDGPLAEPEEGPAAPQQIPLLDELAEALSPSA